MLRESIFVYLSLVCPALLLPLLNTLSVLPLQYEWYYPEFDDTYWKLKSWIRSDAESSANDTETGLVTDGHNYDKWQKKLCKCLVAGSDHFPNMKDVHSCSIMKTTEDRLISLAQTETPAEPDIAGNLRGALDAETME